VASGGKEKEKVCRIHCAVVNRCGFARNALSIKTSLKKFLGLFNIVIEKRLA
jgi:hypothetical protein